VRHETSSPSFSPSGRRRCRVSRTAHAQAYPNSPVRWLIGFAAGGPVDIVARIMSQWLSDHFGQQFYHGEPHRLRRQYRSVSSH